MEFKADTLLQLVLLVLWTVLSDTPRTQQNPLFAMVIPSQAALESLSQHSPLDLSQDFSMFSKVLHSL